MTHGMIWVFILWIATPPTESWHCQNDLEVRCTSEHCEVQEADSYTPMGINFDDSGSMSVCAYTGCWEGDGTVVKSNDFLILTGDGLKFSTAPDSADMSTDIVIVLDRSDNVAIVKAGTFAHPLLCEQGD